MMFGVVRGADGRVLGQHAVDPTAPGGLQTQLNKIAQAQGAAPQGPIGPPPLTPNPIFPLANVQANQVFLAFPLRLPDGHVQWITKPVSMPGQDIGVPPGIYVLSQKR